MKVNVNVGEITWNMNSYNLNFEKIVDYGV